MASPLTLLLPVAEGHTPLEIAAKLGAYGPKLYEALKAVGTVHYARALMFDRRSPNLQPKLDPPKQGEAPFVIAIITEFDGDFDRYIHDFVSKVGEVFDALLQFVPGGKEMTPVASHETAFRKLLAANDASHSLPTLFQAYTATVPEILANLPPPEKKDD